MYEGITTAEASKIRYACRQHYRESGCTESPYTKFTIENAVWEREALEIMKEGMQSGIAC